MSHPDLIERSPEWIRRSVLIGEKPPTSFCHYLCFRQRSGNERRYPLVIDWFGPLGWNRVGFGEYGAFAHLPERGWINGARAPEHKHPVLALVADPVRGLHYHIDRGLYLAICEFDGCQREWRVRASAPIPGLSQREYVRTGEARIFWLPLPLLD